MNELILASASPRRRDLLHRAHIPHRTVHTRVPEIEPHADHGMTPSEFAWRNALRKARAAAHQFPEDFVLAADTVVALESRIFGKPNDLAQAAAFLRALSGRTHEVLTAVILIDPFAPRPRGFVERSEVTFRPLRAPQIARYLKEVHVMDKAGAYAVQENGALIVERILGSRTNVIGLPMERLTLLLREIPQVMLSH